MSSLKNRIGSIRKAGDGSIERIGVIGSFANRTSKRTSDIDLVVFLEPRKFKHVRRKIVDAEGIGARYVEEVLCTYTALPEPTRKAQRVLHISFLPADNSGYQATHLWERSKDTIRWV